jgi:hypothetical protein
MIDGQHPDTACSTCVDMLTLQLRPWREHTHRPGPELVELTRALEACWLADMGIYPDRPQLPAKAASLTPRMRRQLDWAQAADARLCYHCGGRAADWTIGTDDLGRVQAPLCESCDEDAWIDGECRDCGASPSRSRCEEAAELLTGSTVVYFVR